MLLTFSCFFFLLVQRTRSAHLNGSVTRRIELQNLSTLQQDFLLTLVLRVGKKERGIRDDVVVHESNA